MILPTEKYKWLIEILNKNPYNFTYDPEDIRIDLWGNVTTIDDKWAESDQLAQVKIEITKENNND